jgi:uncharacterized protein YegL
MRRFVVVAVLLFAAVQAAWAKLDPAAWQKVETELRTLLKEPGTPERKIEILKTAALDGEPRAAKLVADTVVAESAHVVRIAADLERDETALQALLAKPLSQMYPAEMTEMKRLQGVVGKAHRAKVEERRVVDAAVAAAQTGGPAYRKAIYSVARGHPEWPVRAVAARLAALSADEAESKPVLLESLEKEKDPRVRVAALEALETAPGSGWHGLVAARVEDVDWGAQVVAARVAGKRKVGKAIPGLIRALVKAPPRVAEEIGNALREITGQSIEPYADAWAKWWEAHRSEWGEDGRPLQPIVAQPRKEDLHYYGIKIKSDKVLFIIDTSGSMKEEKRAPQPPTAPPKGPTTGEPEKPKEPPPGKFSGPKIEIAKQELKRAIKALPKEALFDIISFNHTVQQWQPKMVPATDANKELAYAWVRDMPATGSTYIDGALQMAFKMAGMGSYDRAYPNVAVDTIFLLSDGAPTDNAYPDVKEMDPKEILAHVREWNAQKRVVIHCIGIDNVVQGIQFMKDLARENGGTYVDG